MKGSRFAITSARYLALTRQTQAVESHHRWHLHPMLGTALHNLDQIGLVADLHPPGWAAQNIAACVDHLAAAAP